jgi:PAS domain S-box-containing protein
LSQDTLDSTTAVPRLHFRVPPKPSHLLRARGRIRDYLLQYCAEPQVIDDVVLCVEEAATNAIRHSGSDRDIEISLRFAGGDLLAEVKDHGRGFDLASFDREALPDVVSDHGRGLFIVAKLMNSLELDLDDGLEVRMTRRAEARCEPQPLESGLGESVADSTASGRARTRALLEEIDEAFVALDWEYRYVHANRAALHMMGKSPEELYGRTPWEVLPQLRDGLFEQRHRDAMELGQPSVFELRSVVGDDWLEVRIYPTPAGISVYLREINARKRKEIEREELLSALRDSEERYRGLFQSESDALLLIDHESGRVLEANPAAATMYGYTTEELLDLTDLDISAEPELTRSTTQSAAVEENVAVPSRMHRRKDGTAFPVEMTGRVFSLQGRMVRVVAVRDVTARKQAEEALGRFELLAANSRDIILFMDRDGQIIEANAAAERAYGYTRDELLKLTVADLRAAQTKTEMASQMTEADGQGILFESLHRRRDGSLFAVEVSSRGATIGARRTLVSVVRDISERKRAEDRLRTSEARFRLALRNAPVSVAVQDRELRYVWAYNQRTAEHDQIIGKMDSEIFTPTEAELITAIKRRVLDEDLELREQMWLDRPSGAIFVDITWEPLHDENGLVVGVSSATVDLTAMKRAEEGLRQSEERFGAFVSASSDVVYSMSPDWTEMRHLEGREFIADTDDPSSTWLERYIHRDDQPRVLAAIAEAIRTKSVFELEHRVLTVDGTLGWTHSRAIPLLDPDGEIVEWFGAASDVTARKRAEEALRETARLGEAFASIDALVHSSLDFTKIMQSALREGAEAIGAETAGTSMHDDEARQFRVAYIHNYPPDKLGILIPDADDTHGVEAMRTGKTLAISDARNDPRVVAELMDAWNIKSVICAPLVVRGRPIAVAYFNYHAAVHRFSEQEIEFVTKLASSLSGALENAQLFESERQAREQAARDLATTQSLLAAVRALSGMWTDRDVLLGELADVVLRATSHSRVHVAQLAEDRSQATFVTTVGKDPLPARTILAWDQLSSVLQDVLISGRRRIVDFNELPQAQRGIADSLGSRLALHVPIVFAGRVLGHITVDDPGERRAFTDDEIALIEGIASQAAVAIENARLYREQRRIAETLQENFLHELPSVAGLELGVVTQTAFAPELVGGDFSDVFVVDDRHVVVLIGDVAGKGVRAAGMTETVRSTVRALAAIDPSPAFILAKANELLLKYDPDEPHVTAFLAVLDPDTGHLDYASAGHPAPIHLEAFSARPLDVAFGPPLGSFGRPYAGAHTTVTLDDYLVLYTDGVTEARRDGELFGEQRLLEIVAGLRGRSAQELADGVRIAASDFAAGHLSDDLQVVVLRLA